jgi:hypothetical protein
LEIQIEKNTYDCDYSKYVLLASYFRMKICLDTPEKEIVLRQSLTSILTEFIVILSETIRLYERKTHLLILRMRIAVHNC